MPDDPSTNHNFGSHLGSDGTCKFKVWAPFAKRVQVIGDFTDWNSGPIDLKQEPVAHWSGTVPNVKSGQKYKYLIENVGGEGNDNSRVWERVDPQAVQVEASGPEAAGYVLAPIDQSKRPTFTTPRFENFILYQLHVGSFRGLNDKTRRPIEDRTATFLDAIDKLDYIRNLGFTAIALLPVGDIHSDLKWHGVGEGYQGASHLFAPDHRYATAKEKARQELVEFIDAAHRAGLAVIFDVVYTHSAYQDNTYWRYDGNCYGKPPTDGGIYFENADHNQFGIGFATWKQEVRNFFLDHSRLLLRDYRADGIRFDAIHYMRPEHSSEIIQKLRQEFPDKYLIAEYNPGDKDSPAGPRDPLKDLHFCATWDLSGPHLLRALLSGENPVEKILALAGGFETPECWTSIRYLTGSHDNIFADDANKKDRRYLVDLFGGRGNGWGLAKARLGYALNVVLPGSPMLFMGTEAHLDGWWDPNSNNGEHRLDWSKVNDPIGTAMERLVRDVNNLRLNISAVRSPRGQIMHTDPTGIVAFSRFSQDETSRLLVVVNASDHEFPERNYEVNIGEESGSWQQIFNSQSPDYGGIPGPGNRGESLKIKDKKLAIKLPSWALLVFIKV